jgi:hypothetical protein
MLTRRTALTRRGVLRLAAGATATAVVGAAAGCDHRTGRPVAERGPAIARAGDVLVVETDRGLTVLAAHGPVVGAFRAAVLGPDGARLVTADPTLAGTALTGYDVRGARVAWRASLAGALRPRAVSIDGRLVALTEPGKGEDRPYRPAGRSRTTIVVADDGGERARVELPGNVEPEAFSSDGLRLFVLDHLPPDRPDRYRVRMVDLATGRLEPLLTRDKSAVPPGAEEEMRADGRQAVYDGHRQRLFTLYTHRFDHLHTRDLLTGVRDGRKPVHAFVHALSLREQWAFCVDLPAPFGEHPGYRHGIGIDPRGSRLAVVDATTGTAAQVDPEALAVVTTATFPPPAGTGEAAARFAPDGGLLLGAGTEVLRLALPEHGQRGRWSCRTPVRGLAVHPDGERVYVGQDGAVACHDLATGRELSRIPAPGLVTVREVVAAA